MKKLIPIVLTLLLLPTAIIADNHSPQLIADSWVMVPKVGHEAKFEAAMKKHVAYRKENGEKRAWQVYRPVTGDNLNYYIVRTCCNTWAEQDGHVADGAKMSADWNKNVHQHIESYSHNLSVFDAKNSNWPEGTDAAFVGVTRYTPVMGTGSARSEIISEMSSMAKGKGWSRNWAWGYPVGGNGGFYLATPFKNYADMAPMEENFYQFAVKQLGSAEKADAMFAKFRSTFSEADYTIYRHDKELSTP